MGSFRASAEDAARFNKDGYLLVRSLFDKEEMSLLHQIAKNDMKKRSRVHAARDAEGRESKLWLSSEPGEDIYNAIVRCRRMADSMETLMNDEAYLYHYKMMVKEPVVGGAWEWHQDYGYWYRNGCLYPDMASVMVAVDRASKENGCLQVIKGSHLCGRVEHGVSGTQTGADPARVQLMLEHMEHVYCELEPGDALFFHANLLHSSAPNESDHPRWTLICCYNTRHNPCRNLPGHPSYNPMEKWADERVKEIGTAQLAEAQKG